MPRADNRTETNPGRYTLTNMRTIANDIGGLDRVNDHDQSSAASAPLRQRTPLASLVRPATSQRRATMSGSTAGAYCREDAESACRARAQLLGIVAVIAVWFSIFLAWASGAMSNDGNEPHNGATAVIAGLGCLLGIGIAGRAWSYHKASRRLAVPR